MQQENSKQILYQKKAFTTWEQAFETIESWAKQQEFNVIYNRVEKNLMELFTDVLYNVNIRVIILQNPVKKQQQSV
jgi:hypothetical protein